MRSGSTIIENEFKISGDWVRHKEQIKSTYTELTDEDLNYIPGKERELLTRMEIRLNLDREDVKRIIQDVQTGQHLSLHRDSW